MATKSQHTRVAETDTDETHKGSDVEQFMAENAPKASTEAEEAAPSAGEGETAKEPDNATDEAEEAAPGVLLGIGGNMPPKYIPRAHNIAQLRAEFTDAVGDTIAYLNRGATTIVSKLGRAVADMTVLYTPELRAGIEGLEEPPRLFNLRQATPDMYDQVKNELPAFLDSDFLSDGTVRALIPAAVRKAVLLAFGIVELAVFPLTKKGRIDYHDTGAALEDMPQFDERTHAIAFAVKDNIVCPMVTAVRPGKDGKLVKIPGSEQPNTDETLHYLSDNVAEGLYMRHITRNEARVKVDDRGYVLDKLPEPRGARPEGNETAGTTGNGTTTEGTKPAEGTKPQESTISPSYHQAKDWAVAFQRNNDAIGASSPLVGTLVGLREYVSNNKIDKIAPVVLGHIGALAFDAAWRLTDWNKESDKPHYGMLNHWAQLADFLSNIVRMDGDVILFDDTGKGKNWLRIAKPQASTTRDDLMAKATELLGRDLTDDERNLSNEELETLVEENEPAEAEAETKEPETAQG